MMGDSGKIQNYVFSFEKLELYKVSKKYAINIYIITKKFPEEEKFGITSQLRRAAVSVVSNIVEGNNRNTSKDKIHFMNISYCSLMETLCQLEIALDLEYIDKSELQKLRNQIEQIAKLINGFRKYQEIQNPKSNIVKPKTI